MIDEKLFIDEDEEQDALASQVDLAAYLSLSAYDEATRTVAAHKRSEAYDALDQAQANLAHLRWVLDHFPLPVQRIARRPTTPTTSQTIRSPLTLMGAKFYSVERLVSAFPADSAYDLYCEPFCGTCSVLLRRRPGVHTEIVSDANSNLVNFLLQLRDNAQALADCLDSLPYSRELYYSYHRSLFDGTELDDFARAARWFYVLRSGVLPVMRKSAIGWACSTSERRSETRAYHSAIDLFPTVAARLKHAHIENRDFASVISLYGHNRRTFMYVDPPYLEAERYYTAESGAFTMDDHLRLATVLRNTKAMVALSYYDMPELAEWYPQSRWRRIYWQVPKHSQRSEQVKDTATEVLLCNYDAQPSLWVEAQAEAWEEMEAWLFENDQEGGNVHHV